MEIDRKYRFGNIVFRIISPQAFKADVRFEAFVVEDAVKEDYTYEICPLQSTKELEQDSSVQIKRYENYIKIYIKMSLVPEINLANLFSAAGTAKLLPEKNEFVLHASYVLYKDRAILFCAASGIGKSTQAELWRCVRNTITVNEDRAIIFKKNRKYYAGGCWATGEARTCRNVSAPICRIILLEQGVDNRVSSLSVVEKFRRLIAQCSFETEDAEQREKIISCVFDLIDAVPVIGYTCVNNISSVKELEKYL